MSPIRQLELISWELCVSSFFEDIAEKLLALNRITEDQYNEILSIYHSFNNWNSNQGILLANLLYKITFNDSRRKEG